MKFDAAPTMKLVDVVAVAGYHLPRELADPEDRVLNRAVCGSELVTVVGRPGDVLETLLRLTRQES